MSAGNLPRWKRWTALALLATIPLLLTGLVTAVVGGATTRTDQIPALIVNNDEMVTTTAADGTSSPIVAGRLVVTQLTGKDSPGFSWSLANAATAESDLKSGKAYAVITIPSNFSKSIASLSSSTPEQANVTLTTDQAHSYLVGSVAQALGNAMTASLGQDLTQQYLSGLFTQLSTVGSSLSTAASGATQLASGAAQLHDGLVTLSGGASSAASGAHSAASGANSYANGVAQYTNGVDSLASGLNALNSGAAGLTQLSSGLASYIEGANYCLQHPSDTTRCGPQQIAVLVATGSALSSGVNGLPALQANLGELNAGLQKVAAGSSSLRSGGTGLASGISNLATGLDQLASGAQQSATGSDAIASGTQGLASGLSKGAGQLSGSSDPTATAKVVSKPIALGSATVNPIGSLSHVVALLILPAALWLGAIGIFVARRPFRGAELRSTAGSFRIVLSSVARAMVVSAVQVVLALGVAALAGVTGWPLVFGGLLALAAAFAFVSLHLLFRLWWPRAANIISMVLVVLQLMALPGILPSEMLPPWMQTISTFFPLSWAANGMQAIVAQTGMEAALIAGLGLLALGVVALLVTTLNLSSRRIRGGWGFVIAEAA